MNDKPLIDRYFRHFRYEHSECSFTTLYMWRNAYNTQWCEYNGFLCLKASHRGITWVLPPFGLGEAGIEPGIEAVVDRFLAFFAERGLPFLMKGVSHYTASLLNRCRPGYFEIRADRGNFDYVYSVQDLIELPGRKYHGKKNHVRNFERSYPGYQYETLGPELTAGCEQNLIEWCEVKNCDEDEGLTAEKLAVQDAIRNYRELGLTGGVILVGGKVEAFTLGEALNEDTVVIHVEKGNPDIRGIYQTINRDFLAREWPHMRFVNREEDMGVPGLRKAKESYYPVKMIEKNSVTTKQR